MPQSKPNSAPHSIRSNKRNYILIAFLLISILIAGGIFAFLNAPIQSPQSVSKSPVKTDVQGNLVIPIAEISENVSYYPITVDGTALEVLAIKAPDGTFRTAFNTCQVCYASGRGYYKQEGEFLVCQNCGNRFLASDVEIAKGGCNPVPVFSDQKTVDASNIIISGEYLKSAVAIFQDWGKP